MLESVHNSNHNGAVRIFVPLFLLTVNYIIIYYYGERINTKLPVSPLEGNTNYCILGVLLVSGSSFRSLTLTTLWLHDSTCQTNIAVDARAVKQ